jgi:hypoxanthine phosphoribosyltransferase
MGAEITRDFQGQSIIFVGVLKGRGDFPERSGAPGSARRHLRLHRRFQLWKPPTPKDDPAGHAAWDSLGEVRLTKDMDQSLADRNVILVEDILDTGLTLNYISKLVQAHQPRSLRIAALARQAFSPQAADQAHYIGFTIPDAYVVGYGLDYAERYRNLPDICVLENL